MTDSPSTRRNNSIAGAFLALITIFRFWYAGRHELLQDEAYYWQWSRHLAAGYYDNTPALAYVIRFFTAILGDNETGVRAGAVACALVASIFLYLLAKRLLGPTIALTAVVVANIIPLFAAGAVIMTQDPVQIMFWSATLYVAWLAIESDARPWPLWFSAGVLAGLTALSKLNGLLILPSIFLYLCLAPQARRWLTHPAPYVAAGVALVLFSPFVWWNHTHGNAFWTHIHAMGTRGEENGFTLKWLGDFLGAQAILISPLLFLTYLASLLPLRLTHPGSLGATPPETGGAREGILYLWCPSLVVFTATFLVSLGSKVEGNWAVAAYVSGLILVVAIICRQWDKPLGKLWHGLSIALALLLTVLILFPGAGYALRLQRCRALGLDAKHDRTNELYGWKGMADRVGEEQNRLGGRQKCFVFGTNYRVPSELAFYLPGHPQTYSLFLHDRANEYLFWENERDLIGKNAVYANDSAGPDHLVDCRAVFDRVVVRPPLKIYRKPYTEPIRTIQIFACYGFKGYDRQAWQRGW